MAFYSKRFGEGAITNLMNVSSPAVFRLSEVVALTLHDP